MADEKNEATADEARRHNVTATQPPLGVLKVRCNQCNTPWTPVLQPDGTLPPGWWKCPNGCNAEKK
jgi:hypothetical protein